MNMPATHRLSAVKKPRIEALTDGLYSIALTLLVLELKLPALPGNVSEAVLRHALVEQLPKVGAWLLSFWVVALLWILQQRLYHYAEAMGRALVRIELVMLALVSLLPFTTALIGEYGTHTTAAVIYSAHLVALAVVGVLRVWYFLAHRELQTPEFNAAIARSMRVRAGVFLVCSLLTFGLAFMVPGYNMLGMLPACLSPLLVRD